MEGKVLCNDWGEFFWTRQARPFGRPYGKLRIGDPKRGKGKRGGARVIYLHIEETNVIHFVTVYGKDQKDDLRLAALLHDIGHYPYSHLMERVDWVKLTEEEIGGTSTQKVISGSKKEYPDSLGRPVPLTDEGKMIPGLV